MNTQQTQNPALPIGYQNPWSAEHWNVTEQGRAIQRYGLTGAQGLAAAGSDSALGVFQYEKDLFKKA